MASFTVTAASGRFTADHTAYVAAFDLTHPDVPAAFWTDVDADGGNIRVRDDSLTRVPVDVVGFDKAAQRGWIHFLSDVATGSDNEFTVDTDGDGSPSFDMDDVWSGMAGVGAAAVLIPGDGQILNRVDGSEFTGGPKQGISATPAATYDHGFGTTGQGIAYDGTHVYLLETNHIHKYLADSDGLPTGALVDENTDPQGDFETAESVSVSHMGDGVVFDGKLWVGMTDGSTNGFIVAFDVSDLSYAGTFIDISGQIAGSASSVAYNPDDGLLYVADFPNGNNLWGYDPADGSHDATITFSTSFGSSFIEGITFAFGRLYVSRDTATTGVAGIYECDPDGTVLGRVVRMTDQDNDIQGIDFTADALLVMEKQITAGGSNLIFSLPRFVNLDLGAGGGVRQDPDGVGRYRYTESVGVDAGRETWTLGATFAPADNTQDALAGFSPAGSADTHRISFTIDDGNKLGVWDTNNGWMYCSPNVDPPLEPTMSRGHVVYVGTTERRIYADGLLGNTDSGITAKGGMGGAEAFLTVGDASEGGNAVWAGRLAYAYLIPVDLGDEWISDECGESADRGGVPSMLRDNENFWTVAAVNPPDTPTVTVDLERPTGVDASTSAFSAGAGGTHTDSQWQIRTDPGGTVVYDPGDDDTNLTSILNAGSSVPLTQGTDYEIRARHLESSGLYSEWSAWVPFTTTTVTVPDTPVLSIEDVTNDDVAFSTDAFVAGEGGEQDQAQWQVTALADTGYAAAVIDVTSSTQLQNALFEDQLVAATEYRARMRKQEDNGEWSAYSNEVTFETDGPPDKPTIAIVSQAGDHIVWQSSAYSGDAAQAGSHWQVTLAADTGFADPIKDYETTAPAEFEDYTSFGITPFFEQYIGRVRHLDENGIYSDWSDASSASPVQGDGQFYTAFAERPVGTDISIDARADWDEVLTEDGTSLWPIRVRADATCKVVDRRSHAFGDGSGGTVDPGEDGTGSPGGGGDPDDEAPGGEDGDTGGGGGGGSEEPGTLVTFGHLTFEDGYKAQVGEARQSSSPFKQSNMELLADATAPNGRVLRGRFPSGMRDGGSPIRFDLWGPALAPGAGTHQYDELYISYWLKIEGSDYQNQTVGTKTHYIAYGSTGRQNHSAPLLDGDFSAQSIQSAMTYAPYVYEMENDGSDAGGGAVRRTPNVTGHTVQVEVGVWTQIELYYKINDIGPTTDNGLLKIWIGGTLTHDESGIRYRSDQNPKGFYHFQFTPVYGGNSGDVRTRDDYWRIADVYLSGVAS